jgi:hypothetical protein
VFPEAKLFDQMANSATSITRTADIYQYTKLDTMKKQTRLLELLRPPSAANILPERGIIHCKLETFDIDTAPEYIGLSYTWGDPSDNRCIFVDNKPMTVRTNLFDFLYAFRLDKDNIHYIWIDQVYSGTASRYVHRLMLIT